MPEHCEDAFGSIESAKEFLALLAEAVAETKKDVEADIQAHFSNDGSRRVEALKIAAYDLEVLEHHFYRSKRLLNDLTMLRRILLEERGVSEDQLPAIPTAIPLVRMELPVFPARVRKRGARKRQLGQEKVLKTIAS